MAFKTKDLKMTFLGITPILQDETGLLKPQDIVALSALMTFKGKAVKDLYNEAIEKGQDIDKKVKTIIRKSSLRGHASIATTPAICFTYEASKFLDSMMTGMVFSSSLMASGRRTDTTVDDIVYPTSIDQNKEAKALYKQASEETINFFNHLLASGVEKDDTSKILHYGIYGTGIIAYPIESVIAFKKEYEAEKGWMPEEAGLVIAEIEKYLKKMGADLIYTSRNLAARNVFPFPNIFKDPAKVNITRELIKKKKLPKELVEILEFNVTKTPGLEKEAGEILKLQREIIANKKDIKKHWREILHARQQFMRDYNSALQLKVLSSASWRVWGDRKRHRTVALTPESVFYAIDLCRPILKKYAKKIADQKLTADEIKIIDRFYTVPPSVRENKELLYGWLDRVVKSFDAYYQLIEKYKVKPAEAIYVMPRGVRIDMLQNHDLYNLISGYYPLRTCSTADTQLRAMSRIEMIKIKQILKRKGYNNLEKLIVTKCHIPGFCLEEKNCPIIKAAVKDYDEKFHEEMKAQLDEEFERDLSLLGKK
jgi:hypothetical protein